MTENGGNGGEIKRDGNVVPFTRGGKMGGPPVDPNLSPMFKRMPAGLPSEAARREWWEGRATRAEVDVCFKDLIEYLRHDVSRLADGFAHVAHRMTEIGAEVTALKEVLRKSDPSFAAAYETAVKAQIEFMSFLDNINTDDSMPMVMKLDMVRGWNEAHPERRVVGAYVRGLAAWLRRTDGELSLKQRFELAGEFGIREEDVLTVGELDTLQKEMTEAPITADEAFEEKEKGDAEDDRSTN